MNVFFSEHDQSFDGSRNNLSLSLHCSSWWSTMMMITMSALWQLKMYTFSQPCSCDLRKAHEKYITMVTHFSSFFLKKKMLLLQDERPDGEDFPLQLRHSIWCDPIWHRTLPETGYTCGSGETDGLYIYGTTPVLSFLCQAAWWPPGKILWAGEVTVLPYSKRHLTWHLQ